LRHPRHDRQHAVVVGQAPHFREGLIQSRGGDQSRVDESLPRFDHGQFQKSFLLAPNPDRLVEADLGRGEPEVADQMVEAAAEGLVHALDGPESAEQVGERVERTRRLASGGRQVAVLAHEDPARLEQPPHLSEG